MIVGATGERPPPGGLSINADMGESIGIHRFGNDERLLEFVDTINVAGGMHAGDPSSIASIVHDAVEAGVTVGAHPGLPDITGFGRREMVITADEARDLIRYQVGAVAAFVTAEGDRLHHIKPHGALFGMMARQPELMHALCDVAGDFDVPIFGLAGTLHESVAVERGVPFVAEYYVDLDYQEDGTVTVNRWGVTRDLDEVEARARRALEHGTTTSVTGRDIAVRVDSFCVHSDLPNAVEVAARVRAVVG